MDWDLALSEEDEAPPVECWSDLPWPEMSTGIATATPTGDTPHLVASTGATSKRCMDLTSDSGSELVSPATKTLKHKLTSPQRQSPPHILPPSVPLASLAPSAPVSPAFAPLNHYIKLTFKGNSLIATKLCWLQDVTKPFHLDRNMVEVKMPIVTSRFVYVSRRREDIVERVIQGEILSLSPKV